MVDDGILRGYVPFDKDWTGFSAEEYREASESVMREKQSNTVEVRNRLDLKLMLFELDQPEMIKVEEIVLPPKEEESEGETVKKTIYNRKMKQIAVQACGAEESGAHRVGKPDESNSGEIKCMALVRMIYGDSGWDKKMSYRLIGRAFPQQRLVSFKITDAMQIENGRVLTEM